MSGKRSTSENPAERDVPEATTIQEAVPRLATSGKTPAFVEYTGGADVREIDAAAWAQVGIEDQKKVVWDKRKFRGNRVPVADLAPAAIEYCIQYDGAFRLLDEDGKAV